MRLTALLVLLATSALAGPVGRYLGFAVNRQGNALGAGRDSIHYLIPNPYDTIIMRNRVDTTTVLAETVRLGDPAWILRQTSNPLILAEATDTSYESGDTLLRSRQVFGDSVRWLNAYRVPFNIGTTWPLGLAGTYVSDFTGDSIMDTLTIWADTCTVLDTEDVTVPYGTVPHCYKIWRTMYQRLAAEQSGVPVIESSYIRTFEWYKDSLWSIKESTHVSGIIYTRIIIWLHAADFVSTDVSQLTGLSYLGIAAQPYTAHRTPLTVSPNPFRSSLRIALEHSNTGALEHSSVRIFDTQGRLVRSLSSLLSLPFSLSWDGRDDHGRRLPAGAYFVRADNEVCPVTKLR
jgi:hypothetical protein